MGESKKEKKTKNKFNFIELDDFTEENKVSKINDDNKKSEEKVKDKKSSIDNSEKDAKPKKDNKKEIEIIEEKKEKEDKKEEKVEKVKEEKKNQPPKKDKKIDFDKVTENKQDSESDIIKNSLPNKVHISFEVRVIIYIVFILIFFTTACFLILEAINFGKKVRIDYNEVAKTNYSVCLDGNYNNICTQEDQLYTSSVITSLKLNMKYNVDFTANIEYNLSYYAVAEIRITDENSNLLYNEDEMLIEKTDISNKSNNINIDENVVFNYEKYNDGAKLYTRNNPNANAIVTIKLILVEPNEERQITSLEIPFQKDAFKIKTEGTNKKDYVEVNNNEWNDYNSICAGIASVLIIISLTLVYKATRLVLKVTTNRSEYENVLHEILREYDRLIVVARDGYESNISKDIIKVDSFEELLDARDTLEKPIIYSKINNIKSEFIVEDEDKLFKYTLKESDVLEDSDLDE